MSATETPHTPLKPLVSDKRKAAPLSQGKKHGRLAIYSHSQTGRRGGVNQDAVLTTPCFLGVADGVGGGSHGEVASQVALEHCARLDNLNADTVAAQVKSADQKVQAAIAELSDLPGATTLAAVWLKNCRGWHCHAGDARIYLMRPDWRGRYAIVWATADQTYENMGIELPANGNSDDPACMLGTGTLGEPEVAPVTLRSRDVLLLCSDGLHRFLPDNAIRRIVANGLKQKDRLDAICRRLARAAVSNGSRDDISIVLAFRRPWINL